MKKQTNANRKSRVDRSTKKDLVHYERDISNHWGKYAVFTHDIWTTEQSFRKRSIANIPWTLSSFGLHRFLHLSRKWGSSDAKQNTLKYLQWNRMLVLVHFLDWLMLSLTEFPRCRKQRTENKLNCSLRK